MKVNQLLLIEPVWNWNQEKYIVYTEIVDF